MMHRPVGFNSFARPAPKFGLGARGVIGGLAVGLLTVTGFHACAQPRAVDVFVRGDDISETYRGTEFNDIFTIGHIHNGGNYPMGLKDSNVAVYGDEGADTFIVNAWKGVIVSGRGRHGTETIATRHNDVTLHVDPEDRVKLGGTGWTVTGGNRYTNTALDINVKLIGDISPSHVSAHYFASHPFNGNISALDEGKLESCSYSLGAPNH